jgi:hypothetical protein
MINNYSYLTTITFSGATLSVTEINKLTAGGNATVVNNLQTFIKGQHNLPTTISFKGMIVPGGKTTAEYAADATRVVANHSGGLVIVLFEG